MIAPYFVPIVTGSVLQNRHDMLKLRGFIRPGIWKKACQIKGVISLRQPKEQNTPRMVIGMTGASGAAYGIRILEMLRSTRLETHLVTSSAADITIAIETSFKPLEVQALADVCHPAKDIAAPIASGSFDTIGMIIAPCTIRTMSEIATGVTTSLLTRAADVTLKERRPLVLLVREFPLHTGHLRTMVQLSEMGAIIAPPVPAFYTKPESVDDIVNQTAARTLNLFSIEVPELKRWKAGETVKQP
jgi:flavin prenyltransferase